MNELKISNELSLPREAATWVISYLAKRGAGKTYCAADQAEESGLCGWSNWRTAHKHYCSSCWESMFDRWAEEVGFPACGECETFPCKRGRDCWDHRDPPLHWFPYETFFGELVGSTFQIDMAFDSEEPIDPEIIRSQKLQQAGHHSKQAKIDSFLVSISV